VVVVVRLLPDALVIVVPPSRRVRGELRSEEVSGVAQECGEPVPGATVLSLQQTVPDSCGLFSQVAGPAGGRAAVKLNGR
jgi:hypothetical protein